MTIALFALLTFGELVRRKLVAAGAVVTLAMVAFTAWGMHRLATATISGVPIAEPGVRAAAAGIVLFLAFLFSFVVALAAALIGAPALGESLANGEILAVLARPVRRIELVLGRWLGTLVALVAYVAFAGALELLVVRVETGYFPPHPFVALAYFAALAAVMTTATLALAARLAVLAAAVIAVLLFALAWIGGIVQTLGLAFGNARLADAGTLVGLIVPSDALWRGALYALEPAVFRAAAATLDTASVNPLVVVAPPPHALLAWSAAWTLVVLYAAIALVRTRDL